MSNNIALVQTDSTTAKPAVNAPLNVEVLVSQDDLYYVMICAILSCSRSVNLKEPLRYNPGAS